MNFDFLPSFLATQGSRFPRVNLVLDPV